MDRWLVAAPVAHPRAFMADPAPPTPLATHIINLSSGLRVGRAEALSVAAMQRGRNMLCSIATLPIQQVDANNVPIRNPLLEQIDPNVPNVVVMAATIEDLIFEGKAWWLVTARDFYGYPTSARRLDPAVVTIDPAPARTPSGTLPAGTDPEGRQVRVNGRVVSWQDLIRFDSPNPAVLTVGLRALQRAILLDAAARMYAEDPQAREFFTARDGLDPEDDEEIDKFLDDWRQARKRRSAAYVPYQFEHNTVSATSPAELQLAELQKTATLDIANALGVDPEDLGVSTTSRTYANDVDRRRNRVNDVYAPYMRAITDRLSMGDVTVRGRRVVFNLDDFMKSNPTERVAYYREMKNMGAMTVDEIREREKLPPAVGMPPADSEDGGTVTPLEPRGVAASRRAAGYRFATDDGPLRFSFQSAAGHTFSVDTERRTISGLALPYGAVASNYGTKFRFRKGSLEWSSTERVKHFQDHYTPIGRALELSSTDAGLTTKLSVAPGPRGDELLALAEAGVYDGLSVGVDFSMYPEDGDVELGDDGVYEVVRATLREISTTAMPAFDDARVTKVAASRTSGGTMKCAMCGNEHAPNVACQSNPAPAAPPAAPPAATPPATDGAFTAEEMQRFHALAQQMGLNAQLPAAPAPGPALVNPTTFDSPPAHVNEATPYRFDARGNLLRGTHEFSSDLMAAASGDKAASDRVTEFVQRRFAVATGDVNELNPAQNRPDMWVDQRQYRYPLWNAINKGTLANITPFYFPKFNSASGLVGNHTEGVEPTPGTYTTTSQTVTPTAISGKAEINREVWDQGGNPQVSNLIWRKMEQGWYEALESYAVAILDAVTPVQITLTAGATNATLVDELTLQLALLQFVRGGFTMDNAFTQVDLYKALVSAKDSAGRKLLAPLNPANADGTARTSWTALDVNGTAFLPAWALAATGTVAASSYLFDSESVWGWASTPQRLDFQYQVKSVDIAIWGYKAGAITDLAGVREIVYDPTA